MLLKLDLNILHIRDALISEWAVWRKDTRMPQKNKKKKSSWLSSRLLQLHFLFYTSKPIPESAQHSMCLQLSPLLRSLMMPTEELQFPSSSKLKKKKIFSTSGSQNTNIFTFQRKISSFNIPSSLAIFYAKSNSPVWIF